MRNFHLFFLTLGNVICASYTLMSEYFKLTGTKNDKGDPNSRLEIQYSQYTHFLASYYKKEPVKCLEEAFAMRDFAFDNLFFDSVRNEYWSYVRSLPIPLRFGGASLTCCNIKRIIQNHLFEPFKSIDDMEEKFSIIKQLIRFIQKYLDLVYSKRTKKEKWNSLSKNVVEWKFVMDSLQSCYSNGKFDYNYFFSFLHWLIRKEGLVLPEYEENNNRYYFLFATYVNNIIKLKDIEFYETVYPDSPCLISFLLSHIDEQGENEIPLYSPILYYTYLEDFFGPRNRFMLPS